MPDEATRLRASSGVSHLAYQVGLAHPQPQPKVESTPLSRFFRRVFLLFTNKEDPVANKLSGRISELETTSDHMLRDLVIFRDSLEKEIDSQSFLLVCAIIDPIIKEITRLKTAMANKMTPMQQVKTVARYVEWIEKSRVWVELNEGVKDQEMIHQMVIKQTVQEFQLRIDRDVQVIQDYLNHAAVNLGIPDRVGTELKKKLMPLLNPTLLKLYGLKEITNDLTVDTLTSWRSASDEEREHLFSAALHAIDDFFTK